MTYPKTESISLNIKREDIDKISIKSVDGENVCCITSTKSGVDGGYKQIENKQCSVSVQNTNVLDGSIVKINFAIDTTACDMKSPYATFDIPHGLKLINAVITSGNGTVDNDRTIYINGNNASIQLECYAALEGEYTIFAPTVIDTKSKQFIDGGTVKIKVN